jgi:hypothetical protein
MLLLLLLRLRLLLLLLLLLRFGNVSRRSWQAGFHITQRCMYC